MGSSVIEAIPDTLQDLLKAQLRLATDVFDLLGRPLQTQAKRMARHGCCDIPPPCWLPLHVGDVCSLVKCGGTASLALLIRNCGIDRHKVQVTALPVDAGQPQPTVTFTPAAIILQPYQEATIVASVNVPDNAPDDLAWNLFILGCRRYRVRWTVKTGAMLKSSRHRIEIDDCADYRHHWYDHFYCHRPCRAGVPFDHLPTHESYPGVVVAKENH